MKKVVYRLYTEMAEDTIYSDWTTDARHFGRRHCRHRLRSPFYETPHLPANDILAVDSDDLEVTNAFAFVGNRNRLVFRILRI